MEIVLSNLGLYKPRKSYITRTLQSTTSIIDEPIAISIEKDEWKYSYSAIWKSALFQESDANTDTSYREPEQLTHIRKVSV